METVIKDQLLSYLRARGLLSKQQHAFIAKHSTVTNLLECTNDWMIAMHSRGSVDVIYVDFSHAFDSVVHSKLIHKLTIYGISGNLLKWIYAFLSNRFQCVVTEHCFSAWSPVISGVPQGSVLGPILFILYIDDINIICTGSVTLKLFADDLKLYSTIKSDCDNNSLQATLDKLQLWCSEWQLTVNINKCHVIHIGKGIYNHVYSFDGHQLHVCDKVCDLGIEIDSDLSFDAHINMIVGKAYSRIGILFKGFSSRNVALLVKAYVTYIRPTLEYASSVWSPYMLKHINAIEKIQKHFTKRIPSIGHLSYPDRLVATGLEPLELRRLKIDLTLYYKCLHNLVALPGDIYFRSQSRVSQTRSGGNRLYVSLITNNHYANNFFHRCLNSWNSLPLNIVNAESVSVFKRRLFTAELRSFLHCNYF
jgi:hypothetical protein